LSVPNPRPVVVGRGAEAPTEGAPPVRAVGRRGALPNGRAVLGGLLVAAAVVGTYAAWSGAGEGPGTSYVVAARDVAVGTTIGSDDVELAELDLGDDVEARAFADPAAVVGQLTVAPLAEGDLVQRSAVVVPEDAEAGRQVSLSISRANGLAGTVEEGELVDVLVTFGDGDDAVTEVVVSGAKVSRLVAVDDDADTMLVLLSLPEGADVLAATRAIQAGNLTFVRTVNDAPLESGASSNDADAGAAGDAESTTTTEGAGDG
jgi:Flp pilus assembly protein CpaB